MRLPRRLTPHTVTVQDYIGNDSNGRLYGPAREVGQCQATEVVRTVLSSTGEEVLSTGRLIWSDHIATTLAPFSKVTLPSGRVALVISVAWHQAPPVDLFYDAALT